MSPDPDPDPDPSCGHHGDLTDVEKRNAYGFKPCPGLPTFNPIPRWVNGADTRLGCWVDNMDDLDGHVQSHDSVQADGGDLIPNETGDSLAADFESTDKTGDSLAADIQSTDESDLDFWG